MKAFPGGRLSQMAQTEEEEEGCEEVDVIGTSYLTHLTNYIHLHYSFCNSFEIHFVLSD